MKSRSGAPRCSLLTVFPEESPHLTTRLLLSPPRLESLESDPRSSEHTMSAPPEQLQQTFVELEAQSEWRFELESDENIAVRVSRAGCFCFNVVVSLLLYVRKRKTDVYRCALSLKKRSKLISSVSWPVTRRACFCLFVVCHLPCQSPRSHCRAACAPFTYSPTPTIPAALF